MKTLSIKFFLTLFLFLLLFPAAEILSQVKPIRFGVKGGWNYSFTNVEVGGLQVQGRHGINAGGVFEFWVSELFAIHSNVLYNMKGNKWEKDIIFSSETAEYTWAFDYLSIPVLAKFAFGENVKFYLVVGPEFSFLLSGNEVKEGEGWQFYGETTGENDISEYMNSFEFAADLGFGLDISIEPIVLFIDVRGSLGFSNILKETPPGIIIEEGTVRNLVPSISVGVLF
jgi:hypothetical protein